MRSRRTSRRRRSRRSDRRRNADYCPLDDCDGCDGGCDLTLAGILVTALAAYPRTTPVAQGPRTIRPALRLVRAYQQHVSAHRPAVCNLTPTCSRYGYAVLAEHGWRGLPLLRRRLTQCRTAPTA